MLTNPTVEMLRKMRLSAMAQAYLEQRDRPDDQQLSFDERFAMIIDREFLARKESRITRLLKDARLRLPAVPEDIDYRTARGLDRGHMQSLVTGDWIRSRHNILLTGPTGVGKTYIACALGNAACRQGLTTLYYRMPRLLSELSLARGDGTYPKRLARLASVDLLILDDWGIAPMSDAQGRDLLEVGDDRAASRSTLIASQLPVENWHSVIKDPTIAYAVLHRLVHNAHKISLRGIPCENAHPVLDLIPPILLSLIHAVGAFALSRNE